MAKTDPFRTSPLRLNLGSGQHGPSTWVNLDRSPAMLLRGLPRTKRVLRRLGVINEFQALDWDPHIVRQDLTRPLPLEPGSVDAIYSSHFLEHIFMADAQALLEECHRLLRPGGILRLALPDGEAWARELVEAGTDASGEAGRRYQERLGAHPEVRPTGKSALTFRIGGHVHRWQPTRGLVQAMLRQAGFAEISEWPFGEGELPDVAEIETRPESFFTEARR